MQWLKHKEALRSLSMNGESSPYKMFGTAKDAFNSLAECSDGFWVHLEIPKRDVNQTFPFYIVSNTGEGGGWGGPIHRSDSSFSCSV